MMVTPQGVALKIVYPHGVCDDAAMSPHVMQVALATDQMGPHGGQTSTEALTADYVADGHGRRTQERHDTNVGRVGARHSCASWRKSAKRETASVHFGREAAIDVFLSYQ